MIGRRRLLLASILTFTAASLLCGMAPTLDLLVAARALQGLGAAGMLALSMAFVGQLVPAARTGRAMGLLGTMSAVGTALGPPLGGILIGGSGWRTIFLVSVPLGVLTLFLAFRTLPVDQRGPAASATGFDYVGTLLLALTLGTFALAVTIGDSSLGLAKPGLLLLAGAGLVTSALVSTVLMCTLVIGPFHLSRALGLNPAAVGVVMSVGPVVAALISAAAGRAVDRYGSHRMILVGLVGVLAGSVGLSSIPASSGVSGYVAPLVVITAGYAIFQAANNTAVMGGVRSADRGLVSGMANLARNLGLITGASAMGAIFALASGTSDITTALPEEVASASRTTFAVATALVVIGLAVALGSRVVIHRADRGQRACVRGRGGRRAVVPADVPGPGSA
jgi:MFS family permease